jgi:hypothetical protein
MKRTVCLAVLSVSAVFLSNCREPEPVVIHHYHETTRTTKSASVSGGSNSPEGFTAVTPPSSYSR